MNASTSDYSSGCESGWTMYLDQVSNSDAYTTDLYTKGGYDDGDQSMVSDASSGPPSHSAYIDYSYAEDKKKSNAKTKAHRKEPKQKQQPPCLDDTASSSIFHYSHEGNVPRSHDSAAHFEGESVTKKRLSFFKSSTKGKSGSVVGRKRQ